MKMGVGGEGSLVCALADGALSSASLEKWRVDVRLMGAACEEGVGGVGGVRLSVPAPSRGFRHIHPDTHIHLVSIPYLEDLGRVYSRQPPLEARPVLSQVGAADEGASGREVAV